MLWETVDSDAAIEVHSVTVIDGDIYVRLHSNNDYLPNKTATVYVDYILR